jgi:hypothetical protein
MTSGGATRDTGRLPTPDYSPASPGALARLTAHVAAAGSVLLGKLLIAAGLRRPPEGWRRTVGVLLRGEATRFALSAFDVNVPRSTGGAAAESIEGRVAAGLASFLREEADAHYYLEWQLPVTLRRSLHSVDLVVQRFDANGLVAVEPHLAGGEASLPSPELRARVHAAIVDAFNGTAQLPETSRVMTLAAGIERTFGQHAPAASYARRLLRAACLSFEAADLSRPEQRFCPPVFTSRRTLGGGYLSWVGRVDAARGTVDLWVSAHHVGLDGVPLQDMLNRLQATWGVQREVSFPAPTAGAAFVGPVPCHVPGERPVDQIVTFVDLTPVLRLRRHLSLTHAEAVGGEVTLGALIGWLLTLEPEFQGVRIASTVDVAASAGYERDVDVVSLRADDYRGDTGIWSGFPEYAREFNRLIATARARTSPVRQGMQTAGLLPAWAHQTIVRADPASLDTTFGTLCVTIVRDARVFIAPMTDLGLGHGFFAIGSAALASESGGTVTAVSIKGDKDRVATYPAILQRIVDRAAALMSQ